VELILDFAVVAIAVAVVVSLSLLTWTLAVSVVASVTRARASVAASRREVLRAEARIGDATRNARTALEAWAQVTESANGRMAQRSGEQPDG
jgi:biopolymer transport protein ExbB/TolQ